MNTIKKEEFERLVIENQLSMYRLAMSILKNSNDAEDAVSETVLTAYEHLSSLKKNDSFKAWMMTILVNVSKKMLRKKKRVVLYDDLGLFEKSTDEGSCEMWEAVLTLNAKYAKVVILYYYEGFSTREIARILHIPEGTVKSRLSRARSKLQQII
ncbi:MAG: RNA polymerase sigma factor [Lachnospiraceae bacterium]